MDYIAYLHKNRNSDFGISFPDFPGCNTAGKTLDEAPRMAAEALAFHIAGMVEDGDAIPARHRSTRLRMTQPGKMRWRFWSTRSRTPIEPSASTSRRVRSNSKESISWQASRE